MLPHNWTGDRTSFWVRSEVEDANYGNGCDSFAHKRRLVWVGGRGHRYHRIQGESKYYEQFIVTVR